MHVDPTDVPVAECHDDAVETQEAVPSRGRLLARRLALGFFGTIGVLVVLGVVLYGLGGPVGPTRAQRTAYEAQVAAGETEPVLTEQLVVPIPGCVCHSDDPAAVVRHSEYRIRDCSSCH